MELQKETQIKFSFKMTVKSGTDYVLTVIAKDEAEAKTKILEDLNELLTELEKKN